MTTKEDTNMAKYFGDWGSFEDMKHDFERYGSTKPVTATEDEILWATYTYKDCSGDAHVLFEKDGKLWEVYGSHCSCNGLEGQWEPGLVTWEALALRLPKMNLKTTKEENDYSSPLRYQPRAARRAFHALVTSKLENK